MWEKEHSENVRGREVGARALGGVLHQICLYQGSVEGVGRDAGMWEVAGVTGCMCWGWPFSIFQQLSPAAAQLLGADQSYGARLHQDLVLLDKADIWLSGEGSKASEQKTGNDLWCDPQEVFQADNRPTSWQS